MAIENTHAFRLLPGSHSVGSSATVQSGDRSRSELSRCLGGPASSHRNASLPGGVRAKSGLRLHTDTLAQPHSIPDTERSAPPLIPGYVLVKEGFAQGGMGCVHRGTQLATGRSVAVKTALPDENGMREHVLRQESQILSKVSFRLAGAGTSGPEFFAAYIDTLRVREATHLVMSEAPGESLAYPSFSVPLRDLLALAAKLGTALEHMHKLGYIHCDIKPENIHVEQAHPSKPTVLDVGVAVEKAFWINPGRVIGTPYFMPAEAFDHDHPLTPARDIYALGMTFISKIIPKAMARDASDRAVNPHQELAERWDEAAPMIDEYARQGKMSPARVQEFSTDLLALLQKAVHPDPAQRFQTMHEWKLALVALTARRTHVAFKLSQPKAPSVPPAAPVFALSRNAL